MVDMEKPWSKKKLERVKALIIEESKKQTPERILRNKMLSFQYRLEDLNERKKSEDMGKSEEKTTDEVTIEAIEAFQGHEELWEALMEAIWIMRPTGLGKSRAAVLTVKEANQMTLELLEELDKAGYKIVKK